MNALFDFRRSLVEKLARKEERGADAQVER